MFFVNLLNKIKQNLLKIYDENLRRGKMLAVCGIVLKKGRVLLCKRPVGMNFPGFWEPPTEVIDEGETLEDSLEKAIFERLTAIPQKIHHLGAVDFAYGEGGRLFACEVELQRNFIRIYGYDEFRWVKLQDLKRFRMLKPHVTILTEQNGSEK